MTIYHVYKFTNLVNAKIYIGVTQTAPSERAYAHYRSAEKGSKFAFHCALRKYGKENFSHEVIYQTLDRAHMFEMERFFIKEYNSCRLDPDAHGYNMTRGGEGYDSETASSLIRKRTLEGTNPWAGELGAQHSKELQARLIAEGRHHSQNSEFVKARAEEVRARVAAGTHHWCGNEWGKKVGDRNRRMATSGELYSQRPEVREALSIKMSEKHQCEFCSKLLDFRNYKKWHGNNCKLGPNYDPSKCDAEKKRAAETRKQNKEAGKHVKKRKKSPSAGVVVRKRIAEGTHHFQVKTPCEFCGKLLNASHMKIWHGEKCKSNPNVDLELRRELIDKATKARIKHKH